MSTVARVVMAWRTYENGTALRKKLLVRMEEEEEINIMRQSNTMRLFATMGMRQGRT